MKGNKNRFKEHMAKQATRGYGVVIHGSRRKWRQHGTRKPKKKRGGREGRRRGKGGKRRRKRGGRKERGRRREEREEKKEREITEDACHWLRAGDQVDKGDFETERTIRLLVYSAHLIT